MENNKANRLIGDIYTNIDIIESLNTMVARKHTKAESNKITKINLSLSVIKESINMLERIINIGDGPYEHDFQDTNIRN